MQRCTPCMHLRKQDQLMKNLKDILLLFLKGVAMGSADVIPGVSGGTVAFITGIYERLLNAIKAFDLQALRLLRAGAWKQLLIHIDFYFLLVLLSGIVTSFLSLAQLVTFLIKEHPIQLWSFFFGLIIISALMVMREIKLWNVKTVLSLLAGTAMAYAITVVTPATTPDNTLAIFLSGMVAICAMVLPGISGSFILLLVGKYEYIIGELKAFNLSVIIPFSLGCVVGILMFSRVISWFLKKFHDYAIALLAGFMLGALNKIWPWKEVLKYRLDRHNEQKPLIEQNLWPAEYTKVLEQDPHLLEAILFFALGIFVVVGIDRLAHYYKRPQEKYIKE